MKAIVWKRTNTHKAIAAASVVVLIAVGLMTNLVFGVHGSAVAVVIVVLVLLTLFAVVLAWCSTSAASAGGDPSTSLAHGDPSHPGVSQLGGNHAQSMAGFVSALASVPLGQSGTAIGQPLNLVNERELLRNALASEQSSVIVVHGRPGAGKTTLVNYVLHEMGLRDEARLHDISPGDPIDAKTLLDDITSGTGLRQDEDVLGRLDVAMETPDGAPRTVVIDNTQVLLDPDTRAVINLELAEALKTIARGWPRRVKVVLVVREPPAPEARSGWLSRVDFIQVRGLERQPFNSFLEVLDPAAKFGVAAMAQTDPGALHRVLQGNPGLARTFCAVLALSPNQWSAVGLAKSLAGKPADETERLLAQQLVNSLSTDQQRIVVALAAYGTPVNATLVGKLLVNELSAGRLSALLPGLVANYVVRKTENGGYYLPAPEILDELMRLSNGPVRLRPRAAELLSESQVSEESIRRVEDLYLHFAELEIHVAAQQWAAAYELIDRMRALLKRWNADGLLLKYRKAIAGNLNVSFREMVNYHALGCIYTSRGQFGDAQQAFDMALLLTKTAKWPHGRRKINISLGALRWHAGDAVHAERHYHDALISAEKYGDTLDRMAALAGLADCHRRWGDYRAAIEHGMSALSAAQSEGSPWAVGIAVKLARWHSELDQRAEADRLLEMAEQAAAEHPSDPALRVHCLDARADLLLDAGDLGLAQDVAQQALTKALLLQDPVTVVQARCTMATVHLWLNRSLEARGEIERAAVYRREGRSLVVLALQALIAFCGDANGSEPRALFAQLQREAAERRKRDSRDFAAWDFEGLAICGLCVGQPGQSLDTAVNAFRSAREQAPVTPILDARLKRWLQILQVKAAPGQLDQVLAAAIGTAVV